MAFLSNHNRLCQSNYSNYQPGSLLALRENLWDSSVLDPPPPASKAQTKTWLQFCRGKTSHLITRAEKMGLLLIWHLVIFVWERFLPCNFSSDKSGAKLWQNHSPWRPAGVFVSHTHQHHTGLESEGVGVQLTDCPPPSSEMQCILRGGQGCAMGRGNVVVGLVEAVCFVCWYSQGVVMHCAVHSTFVDLEAMSSYIFLNLVDTKFSINFWSLTRKVVRSCLKHELVRHLYWWTIGLDMSQCYK